MSNEGWNGYPYHTRIDIPIEMLVPNEDNQHIVDVMDTDRLAAAIQNFGFRGSVEVYPHKTEPELLEINAGERRYRAAMKAGLKTIPTIIYPRPDDATVMETLISSNVNAREQTPLQRIKEIKFYKERVIDVRKGRTSSIKKCAEFFGLSKTSINRYLELGKLNEELLSLCDNNGFPYTKLVAAITLSDEEQLELYARICDEMESDPEKNISSKKLENLIYNYKLELNHASPACEEKLVASRPVEEAEFPLDDHMDREVTGEPAIDSIVTRIDRQLAQISRSDCHADHPEEVVNRLEHIMEVAAAIKSKLC